MTAKSLHTNKAIFSDTWKQRGMICVLLCNSPTEFSHHHPQVAVFPFTKVPACEPQKSYRSCSEVYAKCYAQSRIHSSQSCCTIAYPRRGLGCWFKHGYDALTCELRETYTQPPHQLHNQLQLRLVVIDVLRAQATISRVLSGADLDEDSGTPLGNASSIWTGSVTGIWMVHSAPPSH